MKNVFDDPEFTKFQLKQLMTMDLQDQTGYMYKMMEYISKVHQNYFKRLTDSLLDVQRRNIQIYPRFYKKFELKRSKILENKLIKQEHIKEVNLQLKVDDNQNKRDKNQINLTFDKNKDTYFCITDFNTYYLNQFQYYEYSFDVKLDTAYCNPSTFQLFKTGWVNSGIYDKQSKRFSIFEDID
ncbi:UNKNOWN [Stylonychia lemnae]|uniref:Uncharacterized protein n=1 Tax=Stylonychia lemnae TaxID=5949 RepID=A0A077ZVJ8_STYLE|nr:UNKNOWN [Stylonychia lemnae]|eukprot:CDW72456.1 UNKNOWN [Stylonychia lemnae]